MEDSTSIRHLSSHDGKQWLGFLLGGMCAVVWGIQAVVTRYGVVSGLTTADVVILRVVVAGLAFLPMALRQQPSIVGHLGWPRALILSLLIGVPYNLALIGGAAFAPALHSSIITHGLIPIFATAFGWLVYGTRPQLWRVLGLAAVLAGLCVFSLQAVLGTAAREGAWRGDLLFVLTALMWSSFGILAKRWKADETPVLTTASICVISLAVAPVLPWLLPLHLGEAPLESIALQAIYQGIVVGVISLVLYTRAVALIGPVRSAMMLPLVPVTTCIVGAVWLAELPSATELLGASTIVVGLIFAVRAQVAHAR